MRHALATTLQRAVLATLVSSSSGLAAGAEDGCAPLFTPEDPRLFEFVKTRKSIDFGPWQGRTIDHISVQTLPIFNEADKHENNLLYRSANRLHIATRPEVLRKQLLIKEGEPLDVDRLHESERILRGAGYLYDAMIVPERVCGDTISLRVVVRDIWTLQPTASFKRAGGQNSTSIGITDDNILGYGHSINLSWDKNADRSGIVLSFNSKHLMDGHTELGLGYAKNDDGRRMDFKLERPFYAFDTRWAAGIDGADDLRAETENPGGVITNRYDDRRKYVQAHVGFARPPRDGAVRRWRLGVTYDHEVYGNQDPAYTTPIPPDNQISYPWIEYERRENAYVTTSNLTQLFRNEDVNIGEEWRVRVGATNGWMRSNRDALRTLMNYDNTIGYGTHHLLRTSAQADLFWDEQQRSFINSVYGFSTNYDFFINDNNRWHAHLGVDAGNNLAGDKVLKAGGDTLLRGYPSGWQSGDRRVLLNVERRHFYNKHVWHLFRLGSAAFVDAGKAWDTTGATVQSDKVLADVGFGLRVNSSKARPTHVMHLDFAMPLTDRGRVKSFQWSVQSQSEF